MRKQQQLEAVSGLAFPLKPEAMVDENADQIIFRDGPPPKF
ncbi:hypothetical protein PMIT1303_02422 [Prochlorococcus sp. MIT 1303]|nr:hypothetical protein PMIT1303_02422 [Prochlorococcus sp. MIT 1303]